VFSYIGFEPKEYKIAKNESEIIDVSIKFEASDIFLMGEVSMDGIYSSQTKKTKKNSSIKDQ